MSELAVISRPSQIAVERAYTEAARIAPYVRVRSASLTTACRQIGLPIDLAELCGGLLASVIDDLVAVSELPRKSFECSKRLERILATTEEPAASALRIAIHASPTNGRAAARHWDAICDRGERGKFAWLLRMDTDNAYKYGKKMEQRT